MGFRAQEGGSRQSPPTPRPDPPPLRAGEDVPRGVQVAEAGAAAAGQCCEELREEGVGNTDGGPRPGPPQNPGLPSGLGPGHRPYR